VQVLLAEYLVDPQRADICTCVHMSTPTGHIGFTNRTNGLPGYRACTGTGVRAGVLYLVRAGVCERGKVLTLVPVGNAENEGLDGSITFLHTGNSTLFYIVNMTDEHRHRRPPEVCSPSVGTNVSTYWSAHCGEFQMTLINKKILATLTQAVAAKAEAKRLSEEPTNQYEGFMVTAVLLAFDLTEKQCKGCREHLETNGIPKGTRNALSRFMSPNKGHENLAALLKGCKGSTLEARQAHLANGHIVSFRELSKACIIVSDDAVDDSIAKRLAGVSSERQAAIIVKADKLRLDAQAKGQESDTRAKQVALVAITAKKNTNATKAA
jgi:hypothetical protein